MNPILNADPGALAPWLAAELRPLLGKLSRRLREQSSIGNLTWSQVSALGHLERNGPLTVTQLAQAEGVRPQSMSATVAGLEAAGLLSGAAHPQDRRQTLLTLTERCRELIRLGRSAREDWLCQSILSHFSAAEQQEFARALQLLKRLAAD
jgi:DNA-binding MarR family transcriptional regulator